MRIDDDAKIFRDMFLLDAIEGNNGGSSLICEYWETIGKLDKLKLLTKKARIDIRSDELQYVLAAESCCEQLSKSLGVLLTPQFCSNFGELPVFEPDVIANGIELIKNLKELTSGLRIRNGFEEFYGRLSELTLNILSEINFLVSCGKKVGFFIKTQITSDELLSGAVSLDSEKSKCFLFKYKMR